jgi:sulfoxide reductase heme-binding subunit YedZ
MSDVRTTPSRTLADRINGTARKLPSWPLYPLAAFAPIWLLYQALVGGLGVEPVEVMEHTLGEWGLQVLIASLCVTPLRRFAGLNLLKFRRALGQIAFAYIALHLMVWAFLDVQIASQIWADIVKRPYITIGMAAFVLLIPLAATSTDWALRRMGAPAWRRLHKLVYPAAALGAIHWVMLSRGWQWEPVLYLTIVLALLMMRVKAKRVKPMLRRLGMQSSGAGGSP